jgi:hypothetical protein
VLVEVIWARPSPAPAPSSSLGLMIKLSSFTAEPWPLRRLVNAIRQPSGERRQAVEHGVVREACPSRAVPSHTVDFARNPGCPRTPHESDLAVLATEGGGGEPGREDQGQQQRRRCRRQGHHGPGVVGGRGYRLSLPRWNRTASLATSRSPPCNTSFVPRWERPTHRPNGLVGRNV